MHGPNGGSDEDGFDPLPGVAHHGEVLVRFGEVRGEAVVQQLPAIESVDRRVSGQADGQQVVQVSAGNEAIVALCANGDVWLYKLVDEGARGVADGEWEPVSRDMTSETHVTELHLLPQLASMSSPSNRAISASYRIIVAYSDRKALLATLPEHFASESPVAPSLEVESLDPSSSQSGDGAGDAVFRRVAAGDYHKVAVNGRGECFTWGSNDGGQLGLAAGTPYDLSTGPRSGERSDAFASFDKPQRVLFGTGDEAWRRSDRQQRASVTTGEKRGSHFVFDICANGWQSGALVVDLPPLPGSSQKAPTQRELNDEQNDDDNDDDDRHVRPPSNDNVTDNSWTPMVHALPPSMFRHGIRIGFAGRAAYRGQGSRRGGRGA